ncbi:hypothetical protein HNQ94_002015 [Salirhabdus euzebyi]|uniref:NERD domain-containing protein n=1 Tax=Salirhabdus euzebyi TaxID=394506 RepID=A0A841Q582_9BACI|nr:NERD domain-containing protein [Salirhabdus euzebyi]MBB6453566.1 hypothetical protein [Salirhabdus euzebyi]
MIKKEHEKPLKLSKLEALYRRLPINYEKKSIIKEEIAKMRAGFHGEKSLDYQLSFLSIKDYIILHDLRLVDTVGRYFQLDTLILFENFALILEVKNIVGTLFFDIEFHQLVRTLHDEKEAFNDPLLQVKRQKDQFTNWLLNNKFTEIPVETLVVISNPSSVIETNPTSKEIYQRVIRAQNLPYKIEQLHSYYSKQSIDFKELKKISNRLCKNHTPHNPDILRQYNIHKNEVMKGVHCPDCFYIPMTRNRGGAYICPDCNRKGTMAYYILYLTIYSFSAQRLRTKIVVNFWGFLAHQSLISC